MDTPIVNFTVYGEPVAQGRPKFTTAGGFVRAYDPARSREYKQYVRAEALRVKPEKPLEGELTMQVDIYREIPKSFSKKKITEAIEGRLRPTTKPDVSNIIKGVEDAIKGIIYKDDSQIVDLSVSKWYSEIPRIEVKIS